VATRLNLQNVTLQDNTSQRKAEVSLCWCVSMMRLHVMFDIVIISVLHFNFTVLIDGELGDCNWFVSEGK